MSIPEIDKIIKLSELFGVSTDYLLKDELEEAPLTESVANKIALSVALFILSPITLIILSGLAEYTTLLSENVAVGIGV